MIAALASRIRNQAKHTLDLVAKEAKIKLEIEKSTELVLKMKEEYKDQTGKCFFLWNFLANFIDVILYLMQSLYSQIKFLPFRKRLYRDCLDQ